MRRRLQEVTQQRNLMRTRHSAADAERVIQSIESEGDLGLQDTFERWELKIARSEIISGVETDSDALDAQFTRVENEAGLQADLAELLGDNVEPTQADDKERKNV